MSEPSAKQERGPERFYANQAIEVHWEPKLCIHSRNCVRGLPLSFDPRRRPWIDVDAAQADEIADVIRTCPTGALHFRRLDGGVQEEPQDDTTVEPQPNGPLFVRGRIKGTHASPSAGAARPRTNRSATGAISGSASGPKRVR